MYPAFQSSDKPFERYPARRSAVHSTKAMVACTQPLAAQAGQKILALGGNAAVRNVALFLVESILTRSGRGGCSWYV